MSADKISRHQEWFDSLDPRVRTEVEAEIAYYKPDGQWEFEESEPEDDWVPSDEIELAVSFSSEELTLVSEAFGASSDKYKVMHDALIDRAREVLAERERQDTDTVAAAD